MPPAPIHPNLPAARPKSKIGLIILIAVIGLAVYFVGWHRGGIRALWGFYSGSWEPTEARSLSEHDRQSQTEARARLIHAAVLQYRAQHGQIPDTLADLANSGVSIQPSLTSTMPWRYAVDHTKGTFYIKWEYHPNAMYECAWIDENGKYHVDL